MFEFQLINKTTEEATVIFGYSYEKACKKSGLNPADWSVSFADYLD